MSGDFMKSALERAMERADQIDVPEEKLKEMEHRSEGKRIAAAFLQSKDYALAEELDKFDSETRKYVIKAVESILLQNILLPKKESDIAGNADIFRGLALFKKNKNGLSQAKDQLANLANYYVQAVKQNYEQLKADVERAMGQAIQQRTGMPPGAKINIEQTPEFQENWRQLSAKLDGEYGKALDQLKQQIQSMN